MNTIIQIAQERGSTAKTKAGAWKYLLAHLPKPVRGRTPSAWLNGPEAAARYRQERMTRTADGRARVLGYDLNDPNTPGRILERAYSDHREWERRRALQPQRDSYGAIYAHRLAYSDPILPSPTAHYWEALDILREASRQNVVPAAHDSIGWDRKGRSEGSAVHHEMYDYAPDAVIACVRCTEGTRYGVKTTSKTYYLVEQIEGVTTAEVLSIPVAKLAKVAAPFGAIIARARGEEGGARLSAPAPETGYKAVAVDDAGILRSIFSGEEYQLGVRKAERAVNDHGGGYYYYATPEEATAAEVPGDSRCKDLPRVIVRCEVAGSLVRYGRKLARTYLRPVEVVASVRQ